MLDWIHTESKSEENIANLTLSRKLQQLSSVQARIQTRCATCHKQKKDVTFLWDKPLTNHSFYIIYDALQNMDLLL